MKYPYDQVLARLVRLVAIAVLGLSVPAFAQFEIAPDHFDSNSSPQKKQALKAPVNKAKIHAAAGSRSSPGRQIQAANQTAQLSQPSRRKTGVVRGPQLNNAPSSGSQQSRSQAQHAAASNDGGRQPLKGKRRTAEKVLASR